MSAIGALTGQIGALVNAMRPPAQNDLRLPGEEPLHSRPRIENVGNPAIEAYNAFQPGKERNEWRAKNHTELFKAQKTFNPQNANVTASALVTDYLTDGVIMEAHNRLAALSLFTRDYTLDARKPLSTVQVRKFLSTSTALVGDKTTPITDYEAQASELGNVAVVIKEIVQPFGVSQHDMLIGTRLAHIAEGNARSFANSISDQVTPLWTAGNFGPAVPIGPAAGGADGTVSKLPSILAAAKDFSATNLILRGDYIAYAAPVNTMSFSMVNGGFDGAFGFDKIRPHNRLTSAGTNVVGFIGGPNAIALAAGIPNELPSEMYTSISVFEIPGLELPVRTATWYSTKTRSWQSAIDSCFGASVGAGSEGRVVTSVAP